MIHATNMMSQVLSSKNLNKAFAHVYQARKKDAPSSDIWDISLNWDTYRKDLQNMASRGQYVLSPVAVFSFGDRFLTRWSSLDSILLKAITYQISDVIKSYVGTHCLHLKGHDGLKSGIQSAAKASRQYKYVIKSDVADFYSSMNHGVVMQQTALIIKDKRIINIIQQMLNRVETHNADHILINRGIPQGCALSPLLGALLLKSLDTALAKKNVSYLRYMDDWLVFTNCRRQLRRLVKKMHQVMHRLKFKLAINKTFIGRVKRGFDFLGYRFNSNGLYGVAAQTVVNFNERVRMLYEQNASLACVNGYVRRWTGWFYSGLFAPY